MITHFLLFFKFDPFLYTYGMGFAWFLKEYIGWHYGAAIGDIIELEKNFLWFGYNFFSLPLLLKTIVAPFYRIKLAQEGTLDIGSIIGTIAVNTIARLVGFFFRLFVITLGTAFELVVLLLLIPVLAGWLLLPFII